jgi:hypothetical protein
MKLAGSVKLDGFDCITAIGCGLLALGFYLWYHPLGFLFVGALLVAIGIRGAVKWGS